MSCFKLNTNYTLKGDQPDAVKALVSNLQKGKEKNVLLGVTGSGKTFTIANVIAKIGKPTLILSPNKTLAGQLYNEFKELFPENSVEYFVSYYDYYQPEAYVPASDTFIEKDASINERIDRLRHAATVSLLSRKDVIVIASVSCIYGIGSPAKYLEMSLSLKIGMIMDRDDLIKQLVSIQFLRNDFEFTRGCFRVRGENVEIFPSSAFEQSIRITFFDDEIDDISILDPLLGKIIEKRESILIFPASHYVSDKETIMSMTKCIKKDLKHRLKELESGNHLVEAKRLEQRTLYDLEMLKETGYCNGIENYSRYLDGRKKGDPPSVLIDFFPDDFLFVVDESHIAIPQVGGMFKGDRSRKITLIEHGFRLPSALDNRPLNFSEFEQRVGNVIYLSATPGDYELKKIDGKVVEQIIRPTGLIDPDVEIRPSKNQVDNLLQEIRMVIKKDERVLVTTLTKKMAEMLTDYYQEQGIKVNYLHSDIETIERLKIIQDLRKGVFSVLIGINLLREGLDIPEVSLIGILEGDTEGFLRSKRSLIQIFGRAARNVNGRVIVYADKKTASIKAAIQETDKRRQKQLAYNKKHKITPTTIIKSQKNILLSIYDKDYVTIPISNNVSGKIKNRSSLEKEIIKLKKKMFVAAKKYHFEDAARLRDQIFEFEKILQETF